MKSVLWHSSTLASMEHFTLRETGDGYALSGTVLTRLDGEAAKIEYLILCDAKFHTRQAGIYQVWGEHARTLQIAVEPGHQWRSNTVLVPEVAGLHDIDLSVTPATNTLVMRRKNIRIGESFETTGAWLLFPQLTLAPLTQKYTRISETEYDYESPTHDAYGRITVDKDQVVVKYLDLWERV